MRALVLALVAACGGSEAESRSEAPVAEPTPQQATRTEVREDDAARGFVGVLTPKASKDAAAPFTSVVDKVLVKLGETVESGQPLAHLDERPLREELAIAQSELRQAKAEVSGAAVEARARAADVQREQRALRNGVATAADVSRARSEAGKAAANVERAVGAVKAQEARVAKLEAKLEDTTLKAPLAGKVALLFFSEGARVEEGASVVRVISSDELYVKFAIPADQRVVKPSDEVEIVIEQDNLRMRGVVRNVAPGLDPVAQMVLADAEIPTPPAQLRPGMVCRILPKKPAK